MNYGTIKVDQITFTNAGVDDTLTVSGIMQSMSGSMTVTGTVQGETIIGTSTVSGATVTGNIGQFTVITGGSAGFTTLTGNTVTGTTANFVSGVFSAEVSGLTVRGTTVSGATVTGNVGSFATLTGGVITLTSGVFGAGTAALPSISFSGDLNTGIYSPGADQVAISTNGTGRLFVDASGRVGIGTAIPAQALEVSQSTPRIRITDSSSTASTSSSFIEFSGSDARSATIFTNSSGLAIQADATGGNAIRFNTNGATERARIDGSGRLLLGTISSRAQAGLTGQIQLEGTTSSTSTLQIINNNSASTAGGIITLGKTRAGTIGGTTIVSSGDLLGEIRFAGADGAGTQIQGGSIQVQCDGTPGTNDMPGRLVFSTTADGSASPAERMRLDSSGRLGLGTSSPSNIFHVSGTAGTPAVFERTSTTGVFIALKDSATQTFIGNTNGVFSIQTPGSSYSDKLVVTSAGLVGIGTSQPTFAASRNGITLRANSSNGTELLLQSTSVTDGTSVGYATVAAGNDVYYVNRLDGFFSWQTGSSGNTERMRIDSSGRLLVGTSTSRGSQARIQTERSDGEAQIECINNYGPSFANAPSYLLLSRSNASSIGSTALVTSGDALGAIRFRGADGTNFITAAEIRSEVDGTPGTNDMPGRLVFSTTADGASSPTERVRINASGQTTFGSTIYSSNVAGVGIGADGLLYVTRASNNPFTLNRQTNDGTIVSIQQDGTEEGTISVSGTTVSYNGAHLSRWSQLPGGVVRTEILRGTVLSNIDEMCEWDEEDNEQLNRMQVSDVEGDPNVSGVFQAWDDDDDTYTDDFYCAMTGDFIIRIAAGVTIQRGQLLMSAGDGTAKPQGDGFVQDKTIAKVTSTHVTCTYDDGSYCVPCVLMAC